MARNGRSSEVTFQLPESIILVGPLTVIIFYNCGTIIMEGFLLILWVIFYQCCIKDSTTVKTGVEWYFQLTFEVFISGIVGWCLKTTLFVIWAAIIHLVTNIVMMDFFYLGLVYLAISFGWRFYWTKSAEKERIAKLENDRRMAEKRMEHTLQMAKLKADAEVQVAKTSLKKAKVERGREVLRLKVISGVLQTLELVESMLSYPERFQNFRLNTGNKRRQRVIHS